MLNDERPEKSAPFGTVTIAIEACGDMSRFNDDMVTFSFDADSLKGDAGGLRQRRRRC